MTRTTGALLGFVRDALTSLLILYLALAFCFVLILGLVSTEQPVIIHYLVTGSDDLSFLTPAEASHLADVAALIAHGMKLAIGASLALLVLTQWRPLRARAARTAFFASLVLLAALIPFGWSFERFHEVLFPHGNWQFPLDSWLITHFSERFFATVAAYWLIGTAALLGGLWVSLRQRRS